MTDVTAEKLRELLDYDPETGVFTWRVVRRGSRGVGSVAGVPNPAGYVQIRIDGRLYYAHRLVWLWMFGEWPKAYVDHVNRDPADNRLKNLRAATNLQNQGNTKLQRNNTTGFRGVSWSRQRQKYTATLRANGKNQHLGVFRCPTAAHLAYCKAAKQHYGQFARAI